MWMSRTCCVKPDVGFTATQRGKATVLFATSHNMVDSSRLCCLRNNIVNLASTHRLCLHGDLLMLSMNKTSQPLRRNADSSLIGNLAQSNHSSWSQLKRVKLKTTFRSPHKVLWYYVDLVFTKFVQKWYNVVLYVYVHDYILPSASVSWLWLISMNVTSW